MSSHFGLVSNRPLRMPAIASSYFSRRLRIAVSFMGIGFDSIRRQEQGLDVCFVKLLPRPDQVERVDVVIDLLRRSPSAQPPHERSVRANLDVVGSQAYPPVRPKYQPVGVQDFAPAGATGDGALDDFLPDFSIHRRIGMVDGPHLCPSCIQTRSRIFWQDRRCGIDFAHPAQHRIDGTMELDIGAIVPRPAQIQDALIEIGERTPDVLIQVLGLMFFMIGREMNERASFRLG